MNLSSILIVVHPEKLEQTIKTLNTLPGIDVHHSDIATGRIVITQEADSITAEVDGLKQLKAMPDIIVAEMVNHYFENDEEVITHIPPELDELEGIPDVSVPPFLNT